MGSPESSACVPIPSSSSGWPLPSLPASRTDTPFDCCSYMRAPGVMRSPAPDTPWRCRPFLPRRNRPCRCRRPLRWRMPPDFQSLCRSLFVHRRERPQSDVRPYIPMPCEPEDQRLGSLAAPERALSSVFARPGRNKRCRRSLWPSERRRTLTRHILSSPPALPWRGLAVSGSVCLSPIKD